MSKTCGFRTWLEESLRDQMVCGISSEIIRQRLFAESQLDFAKAYRLAVSLEAAEKDAAAVVERNRYIQPTANTSATDVDCQVLTPNPRRSARPAASERGRNQGGRGRREAYRPAVAPTPEECRVCGARHEAATCKYGRYVCRVCNQQGHLRRVCPRLTGPHYVDLQHTEIDDDNSGSSDEVVLCHV
ncbi:unnamed protein product [Arctia plantaginis]|uniref:CCHC-type domain-containing protein n=1 Tax=Arctia plantaginis TaxID=874455 RepID=A0A8S1BB23_ARCPL|nr:unnamed protein product [Arctia plantaginis]